MGIGLSSYRMGAFEALEWAWLMLRSCKDKPAGVDEARLRIQEILSNMGRGVDVNFSEKITESSLAS